MVPEAPFGSSLPQPSHSTQAPANLTRPSHQTPILTPATTVNPPPQFSHYNPEATYKQGLRKARGGGMIGGAKCVQKCRANTCYSFIPHTDFQKGEGLRESAQPLLGSCCTSRVGCVRVVGAVVGGLRFVGAGIATNLDCGRGLIPRPLSLMARVSISSTMGGRQQGHE